MGYKPCLRHTVPHSVPRESSHFLATDLWKTGNYCMEMIVFFIYSTSAVIYNYCRIQGHSIHSCVCMLVCVCVCTHVCTWVCACVCECISMCFTLEHSLLLDLTFTSLTHSELILCGVRPRSNSIPLAAFFPNTFRPIWWSCSPHTIYLREATASR